MNEVFAKRIFPVMTVVMAIIAIWYASAVFMNAPFERDRAARADTTISFSEIVPLTMNQDRPVLPAPHQVVVEIWNTTVEKKVTSKRSLIYHGWITLSATLVGFLMGTLLGIVLAVGIVHSKVMDKSMMPWIITSQTIPILALSLIHI